MSLLKHNTIKKERLEKVSKLDSSDNSKKYKVEAIWNSTIYINKSKSGPPLGLYYLIVWKSYLEEKHT